MIRRIEHAALAILVGNDKVLADELQTVIDDKSGWIMERMYDVATMSAVRERASNVTTIIHVSNDLSYSQALRFLQTHDRKSAPTIIIYDKLPPDRLLQLFRAGVIECLERPVNLTRLSLVLDMLVLPPTAEARSTTGSNADQTSSIKPDVGAGTSQICDQSVATRHEHLLQQVKAVASLSTTVLITGETGTGKTRLSRLIHGMSKRSDRPFLALNCGALSESLLDSELFGHVKGAFTGADRDYPGKLSQCSDGTLLLDEIDMLSPMAQVKLLQVVEDRVFQPVGSSKFEPLQARLIVASNRPLQAEVEAGRFRSDLFYRLNVMSFQLPPLRERKEEVRKLATSFAGEFAKLHEFSSAEISHAAIAALTDYAWPGNIRELRNVMERAVILSAGQRIELQHLPSSFTENASAIGQSSNSPVPDTIDLPANPSGNKLADARIEAERKQLINALDRNGNNRSKTAVDLGISRVALYKRLRKLHLL